MQHKRDFEELFKEKYQGTINKAQVEKGAKMRLKVANSERKYGERYSKGRH